jgi:hypothetical protein
MNLTRIRYLGQPAIKAGPGDTVVVQNSPDIPGRGQKNPRAQAINLVVNGYVFNRTGGTIDYDFILIDPNGKEFPFFTADLGFYAFPLPDGQNHPIANLGFIASFGGANVVPAGLIPVGWSLVLRIKSGNPLAGRGLIVWCWAHDLSRNLQALLVPVTKAGVELGPDRGRAWQLASNKFYQGLYSAPVYLNLDSVNRTIEQGAEIYHLAGEDIPVNIARGGTGEIVVTPRTDASSGVEAGFLTEIGIEKKAKGLVLAYPDKIKVKTKENQTSGPLYLLVPFAEFDLPADMNVEE